MYEVNKKRLPKKKIDINNSLCLYKAINEHFHVSSKLLSVSEDKYREYYKILIKQGIIKKIGKRKEYSPEHFNAVLDFKRDSKLFKVVNALIKSGMSGITDAVIKNGKFN